MAITYKFKINQMDADVSFEGESDVINTVHWVYSGTEGEYTSSKFGAESFTYKSGDSFVPYEDSEAFEKVVVGWLESSLDIDSMKANISEDIKIQKDPVTKDLKFTWELDNI
jgi:hypothetical protein